jgi:paraquat-inducible protein B
MANARLATIGLFVLCGTLLALAAVVLFGRLDLFGRTQAAQIVFEGSVSGLGVGAPVTFRGVRVGAVSSVAIELDPTNHRAYIPVKIRLEEGKLIWPARLAAKAPTIAEMVSAGLRAELVPVSLISNQSEVELEFDTSVPARLHASVAALPEIPTSGSGSPDMAQQLSQIPIRDLAKNAALMMRSLQAAADTLSKGLPPVLKSTESTSVKAGESLDAAQAAIKQMQARMDVTLAGIDRLTSNADRQMTGRGADLQALLVSSDQAITDARDVLNNLKSLTNDNAPARTNLEVTLNNLSGASEALRGFAMDIEQDPKLVVTGRRR